MNRRDLLKAMAAATAVGCLGGRANAQSGANGCFLSAAAGNAFGNQFNVVPSCGVPIIDQMMPLEYQVLSSFFGVNPDFGFFDDGGSPNAFSTPANLIGTSRFGTVLFGTTLIQSEMNQPWWGAAIAGIAGHEFTHTAQVALGVGGPTWKKELHADFMAGWYMGAKQTYGTVVMIDGLGQSLFNHGDFAFNDPSHHGTPTQRVQAMATGYQLALGGVGRTIDAFNQGRTMLGI